ncbi:alpha/beta fold hydrolase [Xanthomonadaceae bacterium JHOS43]|nr:alpha/beta fold hydrolase [Xanthomonadaceae bacterium JHOS43]MCX7561981.1 alpha/beta fold hydrolase [Xanthomonadaceae bacterium XH05]
MTLDPATFQPPPLLRNRHVQSVLASSRLRKLAARRAAAQLERNAQELILDCGDGVRLQGFLTRQSALPQARSLAVLLHGWEGRVDSNYVLHTGARLLAAGFDVFRLHFRDHGDTHALNPGLFHSCLIDEVVGGMADLARRVPHRTLCVAGYSLGGNFALRVALRAPEAGLDLSHAVAVCPVVSPHAGLAAIEQAPWFYQQYFMRKWGRSLRRKQALYPDRFHFDSGDLCGGVRTLTRVLVERHTDFGTLDAYLDGYSLVGDRLAGLKVPVSILTAADDPIIPVDDFRALKLPPNALLQIAAFGGHCGFLQDYRLTGFAESWIVARLAEACDATPSA